MLNKTTSFYYRQWTTDTYVEGTNVTIKDYPGLLARQ